MSQNFFWPPGSSNNIVIPAGLATAANQVLEIADLDSINTKIPTLGQTTMAGSSPVVIASNQSTLPVSVASLPLPSGAATEATLSTLNGKVTTVNTGAVVVASSALPSGASTSALQSTLNTKSASAFINNPYDETVITYVGATTDISTVVYKLASVTVNTLTMSYDGSSRLIGVVKT